MIAGLGGQLVSGVVGRWEEVNGERSYRAIETTKIMSHNYIVLNAGIVCPTSGRILTC